ncbi:MAG: energy transducer TonB [Acidobacteria bacterium]|nr:energy transducer TonB [Acidobacteriota bacterium]
MIPHSDPPGVVAAVISAALFAIALVYVMRSRRALDLEEPLISILSGGGFETERELFASALVGRSVPGRGLIVSVVLHVLVLGGTPFSPYLFPEKISPDFNRFNVRIVEFRLPAPVFYSAPASEKPARPAPRVQDRQAAKGGTVLQNPAATRGLAVAAAARKPQFLLPENWRFKARDIVIQPDQPPEVSMAIRHSLPTALLWAQAPAPPDESRLVGAVKDRQTPLPAFSLPRSLPVLQKPNREIAISDLQIGSAPVFTFRPPQLPVPAANVSPVSIPSSPNEARGELPASALPSGTPMNLIALMSTPAPAASGYLLDVGNRPAESQPSSSAAENGGAGAGIPSGAGSGGNGARTGETSSGAANPAGANQGPAKGSHADLLASASGAERSEPASHSDKPAGSPHSPSYPTGNLGVIVVQQSAEDSVLEGAEVLTGQPVYTVYFEVPGAPRKWILQYCVPGARSQSLLASSEGVIRIIPKKTVHPPYPLERIPLDVQGLQGYQGDARRLVVFAAINERGGIDNLRLIRGAGHAIDQAAMATLQRWSFRPAMRGEAPVAVEALFGIPLE